MNNDLLRWGIEDATNSAGPQRQRQGCWHWFWTGTLCGLALAGLITLVI